MTGITQADKDAAADFLESWEPGPEMTVVKLAKAFARHRQQAIEALQADKAKLREALAPFVDFWEWDTVKTHMGHPVSQCFTPATFVRAVKTFHETGEHIPLQETER